MTKEHFNVLICMFNQEEFLKNVLMKRLLDYLLNDKYLPGLLWLTLG